MRYFIVFALLLSVGSPAYGETITATVNGMVCAFCATGIEKSFKKIGVVEAVNVDLTKKLVTVRTSGAGDLDDNTIRKTITNAGYSVTDIKRQ